MKLNNGYSEIMIDAAEHDYVDAIWTHFSEVGKDHFILPDGRVDIILTFAVSGDGVLADVTPLIATPYTLPRHVSIRPHQGFIGLRLKPGAIRNFLDAPAQALYGGVLEGKNAASCLKKHHAIKFGCNDINSLIMELNKYVLGATIRHDSNLVSDAIKIIDGAKGCITITETVNQLGSCERTLRRNFLQSVGLTPKAYASTVRLHNAMGLLSHNTDQMAAIASECGYADQAHMIRDFKCFTGQTPTAFKGKQQESLLTH